MSLYACTSKLYVNGEKNNPGNLTLGTKIEMERCKEGCHPQNNGADGKHKRNIFPIIRNEYVTFRRFVHLILSEPRMSFLQNATPWAPPNDHEPATHTARHYEDVISLMDHYLTPAVCVLGCVGNLFNLVILNLQKFRSSSGSKENAAHVGLISLAISDFFFCGCLFPRMFTKSHRSSFTSKGFFLFYQMYSTGCITTFLLISTWVTVSMAVVRYLAICFPLKIRKFGGGSFAKVLYSAVASVCVLVNLPTFWQYQSMEMIVEDGEVVYLVDIGHMNTGRPHGQAFLWVRFILGILFPAVILIFCNGSLIRALQKSYKLRRQCHVNESASSSKNRVTLMLVIIFSFFVLCVFPCELLDFFTEIVSSNPAHKELFLLLRCIANFLQALNFAFNFILYCLINAHFRLAILDLVTCSKYGPANANHARTLTRMTSVSRPFVMSRYQDKTKARWTSNSIESYNATASTML
ncbi:hypothetical protein CAPTEDRAFT_189077 [Capitella teleta]|uniref:G-protein coupled receptors family 1 profile domain-containing protein n=1 Tax=Capitella teleta TaxID=283909 RepID=R7T3B4_CAPTE|nr:hypothetical protein CAPTEDRAFT_189077 [Capitella teleta]|eukprot:ELT87123.1 hypothetical protein CAPTEDRAFT_189077 [Capitella teleta]